MDPHNIMILRLLASTNILLALESDTSTDMWVNSRELSTIRTQRLFDTTNLPTALLKSFLMLFLHMTSKIKQSGLYQKEKEKEISLIIVTMCVWVELFCLNKLFILKNYLILLSWILGELLAIPSQPLIFLHLHHFIIGGVKVKSIKILEIEIITKCGHNLIRNWTSSIFI